MAKKEKKKNLTSKTLRRMFVDIKPILGYLFLGLFICSTSVILGLIAPIVLGRITDSIYAYWESKQIIGGAAILEKAELIKNSITLAAIYFGSAVVAVSNWIVMNNVVSRFYACGMRIKMSDKIIRLPIKYIDKTPNGDIISRMMSDVSHMGTSLHTIINILTYGFLQLIGVVFMMFRINALMAALVIVIIPISLLVTLLMASRVEKYYDKARKHVSGWYSLIEEDYSGFDTIKAFHLEAKQNARQAEITEDIRREDCKGSALVNKIQPMISILNTIAFAGICVLGGYLAMSGIISVGDVVAVLIYSRMITDPLDTIAQNFGNIQRVFTSARKVYELLDEEEMSLPTNPTIPAVKGEVVFQDVNFSYTEDKPLIENLNLHINPGQKVAIVGPTGGGKTTIVNLLMRFYDVDSGKILIDGIDSTQMDRNQVRDIFGMVLQDTWLFSGTIYDNIAYGKENATPEEVMEAAKSARIDFFIDTMPNGYDTMINEETSNISAGQKQMLTIARAYLSNKPILILDEATSNVDTRTELLIQETMDKLVKGKTSFVIAHRLSTIVDSDIILVVDNGHIVETGTHEQLMAKNGFYTEIYNSQYDLLR
ncbi:MAG TPA: ABC transporter ATP-binding protein [Clostridia bacterium]|nr:ABC transporter ATP-binding protein [Clostridia bacterium]